MDYNKLAQMLFPDVKNSPEYYEEKFPYRKLPAKAQVTRMAPSPTGFIHLGNLYSALADERIAHRHGGVFYLRIEDTDEKRKVDGAVELIIDTLRYFDIEFDEGAGFPDDAPQNIYGPYFQRQRVEIYHAYAKSLVEKGLAYPCFCTEEELESVRQKQEENKVLTGYYGEYAVCRNLSLEEIEKKEVGFISVSIGEGFGQIFRDLGVDYLIEGGQTMNPSTEDMLNAIAKVNAKTIYIFPNNKNIVLAANQARDLTEDKEIVVVPTKTIPQGITAMISYVPEKNSAENTEAMLQAIEHVKTGQITYAVRDTRIDDKEIHEGDMMGIGDHGILAVGKDRMEVAKETVAQMVDDESEVISIYYGADTEEAEAEELATALEEAYPDCDVDLNAGGQPIYYYVISVE